MKYSYWSTLILPILLTTAPLVHPAPLDSSSDVPTWNYQNVWLKDSRSAMAVASTSRYAIFAGGEDNVGEPTTLVDVYDHQTNTWSASNVSQARRSMVGATLANRYVLFAGGMVSGTSAYSDVVDIYDTQTGQWLNPPARLSLPRANIQALSLGDRVVFVSGSADASAATGNSPMVASTTVDMVDAKLQWTSSVMKAGSSSSAIPYFSFGPATGSMLSSPDSAADPASQSSVKGVLVGGNYFENPNEVRPVQKVDQRTRLITTTSLKSNEGLTDKSSDSLFINGPNLSTAVLEAVGLLAGRYFFYAGGRTAPSSPGSSPSGSTFSANVEVLDVGLAKSTKSSAHWLAKDQGGKLQLSEARSQIATASLASNKFVLFGGGLINDQSGLVTKTIDVYNTHTQKWVTSESNYMGFHIPRTGASVATVGDCMVIFAGGRIMGNRNVTGAVDMFDIC
ncbi:hypothetical protein H4R33_003860 [Dimargaris cristalligena]|uniref:Galactose oxidase n=1 Tax=Dimargaris cristalligena TaxID=215637 RepID=A0A4Q0A4K3_9FUNG|nr:hypothetical protein H4R33_003860 [Dimargaris cristalligena]RKP40332.1 hypothetical protein BJ085DRAFT_37227 [Dimargaris cristalligena]|eukprot:RKP40332.1 hypothetical protein BJ085DRAFT_37227 [Dimargaris cristalligena]